MKMPNIIQPISDHLKHLALAAVLGASLVAGKAQAATATYELGPQDGGTTIQGCTGGGIGNLLPWITKGTLPVGSMLRSVSIAARLDACEADNYASDLSVYVDPTPEAPGTAARLQVGGWDPIGTVTKKIGWGDGDGGSGTTATATKSVGIDWTGEIDLNAVQLSVGNGYGPWATWSGTITVEYDLPLPPALIKSFGPGAVIDLVAVPKTIAWTVPHDAPLAALTPIITVSSGICVPASGESPVLDEFNKATYTVTDSATSTENVYILTVTVAPAETALIWNTGSGTWDLATANWKGQSSLATMPFFNTANVIFDDSAAGGRITISSGMMPASTTVINRDYTFSEGPLAGLGSLTKSGTGTLKIDGLVANTYSGGTIMNSGTLHLGYYDGTSPPCQGALGTGTVTLNGGTIEFDRYTETNALIANGGTLYSQNGWGASWSGPITLNADLTCNAGYTLACSGAISGTGGLIKIGGGPLILSSANSYTGKTIVQSGTLQYDVPLSNAGANGPLGAPINANAVIDLYAGTTFLYGGPQGSMNPPLVSTDRTINLAGSAPGTVTLNGSNVNDTGFLFGGFSGTGTGTRTLLIKCKGDRPVYTYTGGLPDMSDTSQVSLTCTWSSGSSSSNGLINIQGINSFTGPITLNGGNNGGPGTFLIGGAATDSSTIVPGGTGVLGNGNYAGNITFTAGPASVVFYYASTAAQTLSGVISGPGAVTVGGTGVLSLTSANTYSGNTTVNASSKLRLTQMAALGTTTSVYLSDTGELNLDFASPDMVQVAKLFVNGTEQAVGLYKAVGVVGSGTELAQITGTGRLLVGIPLIADITAAPGTTGDAPFSVTLTDSSVSILGTVNSWSWNFGDGSPTSSDQNPPAHSYPLWGTYTVTLTVGDTTGFSTSTTKTITVSQPLHIVVSSAAQYETAAVNVDPAGSVTFNTGVTNPGFGGLTGKGSFNLKDGANAAVTLKVGSDTLPNTTFGGALTGAGGLTKIGTNTVSLSGQNTYSGPTHINAGTLALIGPSAYPATGLIGKWTFDDSTANDSSVNAHNGTEVGSPSYNTDTHSGSGKSLSLNGSNYVKVDTGGSQTVFDGGNAMTISAWVKGWPSGGWSPFICKNGEPNGWQMRRHGDAATLDWTTRGAGGDMASNTEVVGNGNWHMVTMTYDGATKRIYVDGALDKEESRTGTIQASTSMMCFGARDNGDIGAFFTGKLDDIYFYNRALTAGEITTAYNGAVGNADGILPANTSVYIVTGAKLDLGSGVSNTVAALYLNGDKKATGTWGSSASTADNKDDAFFSGAGVLNVVSSSITYGVTYLGNSSDGGSVPSDGSAYASGAEVTVLGSGTMTRTGYVFKGWTVASDGSGTPYTAGNKFNITDNVTLYAKWLTLYQDWASTHTGDTSGFYVDPNEDGVPNGLAWMLGGSGTTNSLVSLPTSSISGGFLRLHFTRLHDLGLAALYVEYSATLGTWTPLLIPIGSASPIPTTDINVTVTPIGTTGYDTVEVAIPTGHAEGGKLFARLQAYEVAP